jgi:hypothetical protein
MESTEFELDQPVTTPSNVSCFQFTREVLTGYSLKLLGQLFAQRKRRSKEPPRPPPVPVLLVGTSRQKRI